ncbi:cytochrome P460 family protein [Candidatus Poribacteria bacterium]|nr:cytochrome P460 family protein [Candidatus Poribacteria bacterium]
MLRYQVLLITVLIFSVAFMACDRTQDMLEEVMMDPEPEMVEPEEEMEMVMEMAMHHSWASVELDAPMMTVEEAAAAMNAAGTGQAHGTGPRTVYFNEAAAMANMTEGDKMYPVGSIIVKEVFGEGDMADQVVHVATMAKTDDPMYAERGGWIYGVGGNNLAIADSVGCDKCHAKAGEGNDYVFVSLKADAGMEGETDAGMEGETDAGMDAEADDGMVDDGMADDGMADDGMADDGMADDGMEGETEAGNGEGETEAGNGEGQ